MAMILVRSLSILLTLSATLTARQPAPSHSLVHFSGARLWKKAEDEPQPVIEDKLIRLMGKVNNFNEIVWYRFAIVFLVK